MSDIRKRLSKKYKKGNRYLNFGPCINKIKIYGFRGIDCEVNFEFPVTAITGVNGAGKSTVGQLLVCGYKAQSTTSYKRWYVKDFFPVSILDPSPFLSNSYVEYHYQTDKKFHDGGDQVLTVKRAVKEWSGYKRQPEKTSIYLGLAFYLPKVERKDLTIYSARNLELVNKIEMEHATKWASRILGNTYDDVFFQTVKANTRYAELGMAIKMNKQYSENNMGFGEGRIIHTIRLLENCPSQSLIVLEEPETSLHEFAQHELAKYFMDVSFRRGHQIIFSSHSSIMINALPPEGRKLLLRDNDGVQVYDRVSSIKIKNSLTEGKEGHLIICVEDTFSEILVREIIREKCRDILNHIKIVPHGDARTVRIALKALRKSGIKSIAILDGDQSPEPENFIEVIPGNCTPEHLIFRSDIVIEFLKDEYKFDFISYLKKYPSTDHHEYSEIIANKTYNEKEFVETECIRKFLSCTEEHWGRNIISLINKELK